MTVYCANCGAQIKTGGKFCQACGTPTPQPSGPTEAATMRMPGPPQSQPPAAPYAAPLYGEQPMVAPPRKSGGALKIALIVLAVIVAFGAVAIIGGIYFVKRAVEQAKIETGPGGKAEVSFGNVKISAGNKVTEEQLGVPIYPGAKAEQGAGGITVSKGEGKSTFIGGAIFTTDDSVEQVAEFYQDKLGDKAKMIETTSGDKHEVVLKTVSGDGVKTIVISNDGHSPTKIAIANVAK